MTTQEVTLLAKEKWQVRTIAVLERVFEERVRQIAKHAHAMEALPDGVGPEVRWAKALVRDPMTGEYPAHTRSPEGSAHFSAKVVEGVFRTEYEQDRAAGRLTRRHLLVEEIAEAFAEDPDSPEFEAEMLQVAALAVQWLEYKQGESYRGYLLKSDRADGAVQIWCDGEHVSSAASLVQARAIVDEWKVAP